MLWPLGEHEEESFPLRAQERRFVVVGRVRQKCVQSHEKVRDLREGQILTEGDCPRMETKLCEGSPGSSRHSLGCSKEKGCTHLSLSTLGHRVCR